MKLDKLSRKSHLLVIALYGIVLTAFLLGFGNMYGNKVDWLSQHVVFPETFRQNFYENKTLIPNFLFDVGAGQNIFNFTYYGYFSPGILLSYLLPFVNMTVYIMIFSVLSYVASGILVYEFLRKHFENNKAFACAVIFLTMAPFTQHFHHHIMFVWYIPYFVLSLIALDRYFEKGKYLLFVISAFLMIMTNYYFSVSALVFLFVYAVFLILKSTDKLFCKEFFKQASNVVVLFIIPVALCGFLLLPTANQIFANTRTYSNSEYHSFLNFLYPKFQEFFYTHLGTGLSATMLFAVLGNLCSKKKDKADIFLNVFAVFVVSFPLFVYLLNGMLYDRGKVAMTFSVLFLYCFCSFIQKLSKSEINLKRTLILFSCYLVFSFFTVKNILIGLALVAEICLMLLIIRKKSIRHIYTLTAVVLLIATVACNIYSSYVPISYYKEMYYGETQELFDEASNGFYRTNVAYRSYDNSNKVYGDNSHLTSVYSSTSNRLYQDFYTYGMGNNQNSRNCFVVSGSKNELFHTFMGTKYIVSNEDPGFYYEEILKGEKLNLYENNSAYPIAYQNANIIGKSQFDELGFPYNVETLMQFSVVDKADKVKLDSKMEQVEIKRDYKFTEKQGSFYTIDLDDKYKNKILYLSFDINSFAAYDEKGRLDPNGDLSIAINGISNKLTDEEWLYYNGNTNFEYVIPLENKTSLDIVVSAAKCDIKNTKMFVSDVIYFAHKVPNDFVIDEKGETISCKVTAGKDEYFVTTIPFDKGFTAYINDEQVPVEIVNETFVGIKLHDGKNNIEIKYSAPWFKEGVIVSLFGLLLLIATLLRKFVFDFVRKHREISMYIIFGAATTLVSLVVYFLCAEFIFDVRNPWQLQAANIISWVISVLFAYVTNKKYVFRSNASALKEIVKFYLSRVGTLLVDMALMYVLVTLCSTNDKIAKIAVQVVVIVLNYILGKLLVFKGD